MSMAAFLLAWLACAGDGRRVHVASGGLAEDVQMARQPGEELPHPSNSDLARKGPLTRKQVEEFYERGVVLVRGLLHGDLLEQALQVRETLASQMPPSELYGTVAMQAWNQEGVFEELALRSPMAAAAEQLTPPSERGAAGDKPLRVLRDAFFSMSAGQIGCGWHVDDDFFWPTKANSPGPGVNVWVALDTVEEGGGGGLAYAPGSHLPGFLPHRYVIRPQENSTQPRTCEMKRLSPECHKSLEAVKESPALEPGDAVILTRFMFHRGDPLTTSASKPIARYSVRYVPETTELEGINFVSTPEGKREMVKLSSTRICDAGAEHGHFPATDIE